MECTRNFPIASSTPPLNNVEFVEGNLWSISPSNIGIRESYFPYMSAFIPSWKNSRRKAPKSLPRFICLTDQDPDLKPPEIEYLTLQRRKCWAPCTNWCCLLSTVQLFRLRIPHVHVYCLYATILTYFICAEVVKSAEICVNFVILNIGL